MSALKEQLQTALEHNAAVAAALQKLLEIADPEPVIEQPARLIGLQNVWAFFEHIRGDVGELFPRITQSQVDGIQETLRQCAGLMPTSWTAYVLATEYHETAKRMQPVREGLDVSDAWRKKNLKYYPWYGRGEVQLTWEANYKKATDRLRELAIHDSRGNEVDLVANPDQALDPVVSTAIMIYGMLEGWFTGKKLRDYIPAEPTRQHFRNARQIVNGMDRADLIAGYAEEFYEALKKGDWK